MSKYLLKVVGKKQTVAHIWDGSSKDTACRLWSTGGIHSKENYVVRDDTMGRGICQLCKHKTDPVLNERQQQQSRDRRSLEIRCSELESKLDSTNSRLAACLRANSRRDDIFMKMEEDKIIESYFRSKGQ